MKFLDEYRDPVAATRLADEIHCITTRPWTIMEVCGGQTHAIMKNGIDKLLPATMTLLHGPGCPVCVTPIELIDKAIALARQPQVILCSFGDMLRVPGSSRDLLSVKAEGADVRTLYSPLDSLKIAEENPDREVVFFAIGFETTAPINAATVREAKRRGLPNFSVLVAQVLVPPAIAAILDAPDCRVQALLAPGHVCAVSGWIEYERLSATCHVPIVVTGFEPLDILEGIAMATRQLERGTTTVENQYRRAVKREGNLEAQRVMNAVFEVTDRSWRGFGVIKASGLVLRDTYSHYDAERKFTLPIPAATESTECISGLILQGRKKPPECPAFAVRCTPARPLGATMVSDEGACAAYYRYNRVPA
ncbi:MAG TPA: hydrogenase formation protein HypD [Candidatus Deferrimicrobium sp.]|nr:hydrogenase formation protein HypD [Candidatus Deferrimicrobium sp.]